MFKSSSRWAEITTHIQLPKSESTGKFYNGKFYDVNSIMVNNSIIASESKAEGLYDIAHVHDSDSSGF